MQTYSLNEPVNEILSSLMYSSYEANRGYGMSHEALVRIGIGNDAMKELYESKTINDVRLHETTL